jgi:xanthine dehydrogenase YagR molybdenum-binding subunit
VTRIDSTRAKDAPGVRAAGRPGDVDVARRRRGVRGQPVAALAADTHAQARAALELIDVEWEELEPLLDPRRQCAASSLIGEPRARPRGDYERGLAEADVVVEAEYRTQTFNHNPLETHQCVCEWRGDGLDVYISTQYDLGRPRRGRRGVRPARRQGARHLRVHGRRLRREGRAGDYTLHRRGARAPDAVGRFAALDGARRTSSRQPQRDDPAVTAGARADGTLVRSAASTLLARLDGWLPATAGRCRCSTRARTFARSSTARS